MAPGVTPALLREIDVPHCPVTREPLTHGLLSPTDASVDRLDNNGAYIAQNLAVMSRRANEAKGHLSFDEVLELARQAQPTQGLQPVEWLRLASLMLGPCHARRPQDAPLLPLLVNLPARIATPVMQVVQQALVSSCSRPAGKNALVRSFRRCLPDERARLGLALLADTVHSRLKAVEHDVDVWLDAAAMAALQAWRALVGDRHWGQVGAIAAAMVGARRARTPNSKAWSAREAPMQTWPAVAMAA
jgi:hypothetical protein